MGWAGGWEQEWWQLLPQETAAPLATSSGYNGNSRSQRARPGPVQYGGGGDVGRCVACWERLAAACERSRNSHWGKPGQETPSSKGTQVT